MKSKPLIHFMLFLLTLFSTKALAQENSLSDLKEVNKGRFSTLDGRQIKFSEMEVNGTTLRFKDRNTGLYTSAEVDEITLVEEQKGSYAALGALAVGGSGLLGSLLGIAQVSSDPFTEIDEGTATALTVGFTVGGALIGALIGSGIKKYKTAYRNPNFDWGNVQLQLNWNRNANQPVLGLNCRF